MRFIDLLSGAALLAVAGCAALPGGGPAPLDTYELSSPSVSGVGDHRRIQILVTEPTALKALDGQNIVIEPTPGAIEYLKGAQWADRLPRIVQARLVETFQKSGAFGGVGRPGEGLAIDYQVLTEVRSFSIRANGPMRAEVELLVKILNDRNGVVRADRVFSASAPVNGGGGNAAYVSALDQAFNQVAGEILAWASAAM